MAVKFLFFRLSALSISLLVGASALMAQDYYDDDIYYDASKAKKETKRPQKAKNNESRYSAEPASQYYYDGASYVPWNNVGEYQSPTAIMWPEHRPAMLMSITAALNLRHQSRLTQ